MPKKKNNHNKTTRAKKSSSNNNDNELKCLSREDFERLVFERDGGVCIFCNKAAVEAHHIIERKLFGPESGGYFLDNGVSVCSYHHLQVEMTKISCGKIRRIANIQSVVIPDGWKPNFLYDKWGNIVHKPIETTTTEGITAAECGHDDDKNDDDESTYPRRPGPMFELGNVQKILKQGNMMWVFDLPLNDDNGNSNDD